MAVALLPESGRGGVNDHAESRANLLIVKGSAGLGNQLAIAASPRDKR